MALRLPRVLGGLGLVGRIVGILLLVLLALTAAGLGIGSAVRERAAEAERLGRIDRIVAAIRLIEVVDEEARPLALAAVAAPGETVALAPMPVAESGARRMPGVEWVLRRALGGRWAAEAGEGEAAGVLVLGPEIGERRGPVRDLLLGRGPSMTVAVELGPATGGPGRAGPGAREAAVFSYGPLAARGLFGVATGFWVGALGCLFAALAVLAVMREASPLRRLAASVEGFAADGRPREVRPRGAPELRRLATAVNAMQSRIAELISARTMLLGALGHDLRTLVTRLRLRIEDIDDHERRARAEADLEAMARLVDDTLSVARGQGGGRLERVDLAALAAREVAAREGAAIRLRQGGEGDAEVMGDPVAIGRLLSNLVDNALAYGERAEIAVEPGETVQLLVDDAGPGIPPAMRDLVFEPFRRLEPSRSRATGGSGLGLAIARQVVEAHGGRSEIAESPMGGARLAVSLPSAPVEDPDQPQFNEN